MHFFENPVIVVVDGVKVKLESAGLHYTTEDKIGVSSRYNGKIKKTPWQYYCPYDYYLEVQLYENRAELGIWMMFVSSKDFEEIFQFIFSGH